jgi:hypothetical protein
MENTKKPNKSKRDFKTLFGAEWKQRLLIKHGGNASYSNSQHWLCATPLDRSTCYKSKAARVDTPCCPIDLFLAAACGLIIC